MAEQNTSPTHFPTPHSSSDIVGNESLAIMDPLAAAGLAGNIITFVDFVTKVLSRARQLSESASGATAENDELESLTKNLKTLADSTRRRPSEMPQDHFHLNITSETILDNLSQQCIQVADELLETLDSVKVKGDGRTRNNAVQAVKTVWKQDHIDALQRRLDRISRLLVDGMSMEQLGEINRRLREMAVENTRLEANRSKEIDQLRRDFNSAIEEIKANVEEEQMPGAWLVLSDTARRGQAYFAEQVILQSLRFSSIDSRHESISKEHSHTFLWIFNETSSIKFVEWLKEEDGVYWVSGKPGSGKSTLIKFVAEHEQTKRYLEEWAGDKKLVIANFYFWSASTHRSQKSQRGLLRTILYQILRQCPELIQTAYHDQWIAMASDGKVLRESRDELLTVPALLNTLRKISTSTASDTKFCFFLDGLDEYDGRPADIIELIDILKSFRNVKTCVSSRPWNEFEDRFGNDSPWKLYMHDLTRDDISLYVEETLGENPRFRQLQKEDPQCPNFIWNIVKEADGVFLWVFLIIRSLLEGLTNSDRIKDLQERVDETPKDLKDYFKTILFSTENRYRTQTARIFTVTVDIEDELPLMAYWVIDQENPKYMFQCPVGTPAEEILNSRLENMRRRLKVLSKGLLEVEHTSPKSVDDLLFGFTVGFLHRTVKDYLQTPDAQLMLQSWSDDTFNVDWEVCSALGALAKMAPRESFRPRQLIWSHFITFFSLCAPRVDRNPLFRADMASMLEHLQTALAPAFEENKDILYRSVMDDAEDGNILRGKDLEPDLVILSACVCFGVLNFVVKNFAKEPQLCSRVTNHVASLLWSMYQINMDFLAESQKYSDISMLELLLTHGVDPNSGFSGKSEWRLILEDLADNRGGEDRRRLKSFEAIKLLLRHGADFEQQCTGMGGNTKANELLREWFDADQYGVLEDIVKRRASKTKKSLKISKKMHHLKLWISSKK
ncbi:hypothetical protein FGG08_002183 [Glutinoglossum americanum]|uniref:HAMP domain-containing protein n=1 Tax=Glutinoglossum americanum TaxID=1670608 RepID=A0A9P8IDD0_9PEZI|nr:hypothetical protein FGG08_002183 [Glutinoglossum americanum]